ncbi:hypothetical protein JRI60_03390 [Archangium violaceum]|uniref:hypothetical protein n=1 Tax=Archangium violaceum TaxID=83451 RepID=UPI001951ADC3|nr:hypothetical protein [Archangium violaceum]QRN98131.1 hypothetical protein JRI60_03390 [Archangium violaceum]
MANEKKGKDGGTGPFQLGRRYEEVGLDLGSLHEARHVGTGRAALTLLPGARVEWKPEGPWRVRLTCDPELPSVTLEVEHAPASAQVTQLADILVLMTAAVERVEDNAQVHAHLVGGRVVGGRVSRWERWGPRAVAGFAVLALSLGVWLHGASGPEHPEPTSPGVESQGPTPTDAPDLISTGDSQTPSIAYPLPAQPFRNQAKAPCRTQADEVAINGGCWMELARRPPCSVTQAEYQGKCYMPVSKDRGRLPQSVQP